MFILIKARQGYLDTDNEVTTYPTLLEAERAMEHEANDELYKKGLCLDTAKIGEIVDSKCNRWGNRRSMYCELYDGPNGNGVPYCTWTVFEVEGVPNKPHMNPNIAETVSYECSNDPKYSGLDVLMHQATVRWNSGKYFKCHAPERVELRVGGTSYEYKAV